MPEAVIVATARTPVGRAGKGSLIDARPDDLGAFAIREALAKVPQLAPGEIEDVYVGCGFPEEESGMNLGRRVALLAGLPDGVPGATVNRFCASSLQTQRMAFHAIRSGEGDAYVAAGVESISRVPQLPRGAANGDFSAFHPDQGGTTFTKVYMPMGMTAENVAERFGITREEMDRFGKRSQDRAVAAQERGFFDHEITPYPKPDGAIVSKDDGPRAGTTLEKLAELKPAFKPDGRVTAGNACPLNDGAAAVVIMSDERARQLGIAPLARILATAVSGVDPEIMGVGPIEAIRTVLKRAGMSISNVEQFELNEAFAAQVIPVCREVGIDPFDDRVNPNGGAIAIGHPYGMTGARIMCTLLNGLRESDRTVGLETMCVGGGQGMAMIIERPS
jgi:acetyl-CoA C-acetyltransferase